MLQCDGCGSQAFIECTCPPGHTANVGQHHPECSHADIGANLDCGCCDGSAHPGLSHDAAAIACPGGHVQDSGEDAPCPVPDDCGVWKGATAEARHPHYRGAHPLLGDAHQPGDPVPACPGGHCHKDVPGCTVCRPITITLLPGTQIQTVAG